MIIQLKQETLFSVLSSIVNIIDKKYSQPILSMFLLKFNGSELIFTATDLELQICIKKKNDIKLDMEFTLPAKKILGICRFFDAKTTFSLNILDNKVTLTANKSKFNLQTLPAFNYPKFEFNQDVILTTIHIPQKELKRGLNKVEFAIAQQNVRYYLNGLLFELSRDNINLVGTDGHRMSYFSIPFSGSTEFSEGTEKKLGVLIPRKTVVELNKLLKETEDLIQISFSSVQIKFCIGEIEIASKLIDSTPPDYLKIIPKEFFCEFTVDRQLILSSIQKIGVVTNEKFRGVRFLLSKNKLGLLVTNSEQEEAQDELDIAYDYPDLDIGFNIDYLIDVMNNATEENVNFSFSNLNNSCVIRMVGNDDYKHVLMPMRI